MFRLDESDSTAETPVVGDGRREMSMELQTRSRKETPSYSDSAAPLNTLTDHCLTSLSRLWST